MNRRQLITRCAEETIQLGIEMAGRLTPPVLVMLYGELGAGKTTLAKGIVSGLGVARLEEVTSPSFTLVHVFRNHCKVYHVDLYRVADGRDLQTIGLEDLLSEPAVVVVEWAEKLTLQTDYPIVEIRLEFRNDDERSIAISDPCGLLGPPAVPV